MLGSKHWDPPSVEVEADFLKFSSTYDSTFFESISQTGSISSSELAQSISQSVAQKEARSFIRIGDGEGNILHKLSGLLIGPRLRTYCLEKISYIHFGDRQVVPSAEQAFTDLLTDAFQASDVVGLVGHASISAGFDRPDPDKDVRAIVGQRVSAALGAKCSRFTDIWFNRALLKHYPSILGGQDIVIISSYTSLKEVLCKCMNLNSATVIPVPEQAVFSRPSERKDTKHYPDGMMRIIDAIDPTPGQIYLIGAGLLGKYYAKIVKDRGGIAIDIGSVPEIWLGIPARGLSQDYIEKWRLV